MSLLLLFNQANVVLPVSTGSFALTGQAAPLQTQMPETAASYALTGIATTFQPAIVTTVGGYVLTGNAAAFQTAMPAAAAAYALTGSDALLLPPLATGPWRRLRSTVKQLPEQPTDPELHRIRILAKRARYAAEAVAPVVGPGATNFARAAAKLQTILGEHQDSVTAQAWLRSVRVTGRRAFVAGELIAVEHLAAQRARKDWPKVWKALDRKSLRKWMPVKV